MGNNDWEILFFPCFADRYYALIREVKELKSADPLTYKSHPKTKLLARLHNVIWDDVPSDPNHKKFMLGRTLGDEYKEWRRVKEGLPPRYRLFFRFRSAIKVIIYVWLNDEFSLRKEGGKSDVYAVFKKMLQIETIPNDIDELIKSSQSQSQSS